MPIHAPTLWVSSTVLLAATSAVSSLALPAQKGSANRKPTAKSAPKEQTGAQLFAAQCADCHGAKGEGGPGFARALTGSQSIDQLTRYLSASMPPGPKHVSSSEAKKLAPYIYDAFYGPIAQERNTPARVALSRLTVRQYKNTVADLIGSFRGGASAGDKKDAKQGLRAQYFKARSFNQNDRVMERVDPEIHFDFGRSGPDGGTFEPHQFSIRWEGSLTARDTGVYEIGVKTEHAVRMWVNDNKTPLVDAWVQSGKDPNHSGSLYLVGGRTYPVRIEFTKSTQGVDDTEKKKKMEPAQASVTLFWKPPHQAQAFVPARALSPDNSPELFVSNAPFPPDDRSMGYERGNQVSKEWDEATTSAALETADYVQAHLRDLAGSADDPIKLKAFCRTFVERGLRRPLDADTEKRYVTNQFDKSPNTDTAVRRVVLMTLISPRFLYHEPGAAKNDPYAVASRLSYALWDSMPDAALMQAAQTGKLSSRADVLAQAERMASNPRAWSKEREFLLQWLKLDQTADLIRDPKRFPDFTPQVASDLRTSLDLELENVLWRSDRADLRELLTTNQVWLNGRLAPLYGAKLPAAAPFQPVALDPTARAGILTHPYLLANFSYFANSSPIHRGVLLTRNIMGRVLAAPPAAFTPLDATSHPNLTTRQRVALQTKPAACASCHQIINPLGFTMERFDAIGRLRSTENNKPIDTTGSYVPKTGGKPVPFTNAKDLARYVAQSDDMREAFVQKFFQYTTKQPVRAYGPQMLPGLKTEFAKSGYNVRKLSAQIATECALPTPATTNPKPVSVASRK